MRYRTPCYNRVSLPGLFLLLIIGSLCAPTVKSGQANDAVAMPAITYLLLGTSDEVALGPGGKVYLPKGSLPPGTKVTVQRAIPPVLTDDLIAVGSTYRVTADNQPAFPVKLTLPVPPGEDPDNLIVVRMESHGRITLLQTQVENGQLVAWTPGFSRFLTARLMKNLNSFIKPVISGPDILPINMDGQYTEQHYAGEIAMPRTWSVYEHSPGMEANIAVDNRSMENSRAILSTRKAGGLTLAITFTVPNSGLSAFASKLITIVNTLEPDQYGLMLNVHGPNIVDSGQEFDIKAVLLNTELLNVAVDWRYWLELESGVVESGNAQTWTGVSNQQHEIDVKGLMLDNSSDRDRKGKFVVSATSSSGLTKLISHDITVLHNNTRIINFSRAPTGELYLTQSKPNIPMTFEVEIRGGTMPHNYRWIGVYEHIENHNGVNSTIDRLSQTINDPGYHHVEIWINYSSIPGSMLPAYDDLYHEHFSVRDKRGNTAENFLLFNLTPSDSSSSSTNKSTKSATVDKPVPATLKAWGGVMYLAAGHCPDYLYWIDWGDGSSAEYGQLASADPQAGASINLSHTYSAAGSYTIKYYAIPKGCRETPINSLIQQNYSGLPFKSAFITVEEPPTDDYVVWYMDNVRCWDAPRVYATQRDGFNREEDTCNIPGGGINCDIKVEKIEMQGGFATLEAAQAWFCSQITTNWYHRWCNNRGPRVEISGGSVYTLQIPCDLSEVPFKYP